MINVTGPLLISATSMRAPNTPSSTRAPSARSSSAVAATSGSATGPGAAAFPGRTPALAGVTVKGELRNQQDRRAEVRARLLALQDPQCPELRGQPARMLTRVVVGDTDQDAQTRLGDLSDDRTIDPHRRLGDPLNHSSHADDRATCTAAGDDEGMPEWHCRWSGIEHKYERMRGGSRRISRDVTDDGTDNRSTDAGSGDRR
jgi:hypothetical protein